MGCGGPVTLRAEIYNTSTPALFQIVSSTRILSSPGPKWEYTVRRCLLEYDSGDVKPYAGSASAITAYNVWELDNTTSTWFGLGTSTYKGLVFQPAPNGAVVLASAPAETMVDSSGAPDVTKSFWLLFQWANQLAGDCS
jgi:hypothetical protein